MNTQNCDTLHEKKVNVPALQFVQVSSRICIWLSSLPSFSDEWIWESVLRMHNTRRQWTLKEPEAQASALGPCLNVIPSRPTYKTLSSVQVFSGIELSRVAFFWMPCRVLIPFLQRIRLGNCQSTTSLFTPASWLPRKSRQGINDAPRLLKRSNSNV